MSTVFRLTFVYANCFIVPLYDNDRFEKKTIKKFNC